MRGDKLVERILVFILPELKVVVFKNIYRTQAGVHKVSLMATSLATFIGVLMFLAQVFLIQSQTP